MRNWIRIFLVSFFLVGGTAFFVYLFLNQFNNTLDSLSALSFANTKAPSSLFSEKANKKQVSTSTPETISVSATSTDEKLALVFSNNNTKVYIGCTYQLLFESSTTTNSLGAVLIDADTLETIEPITSGLAEESKFQPDSQRLNWKVGAVSPSAYYIKVTSIDGVDADIYSSVFTVSKIPKGIGMKDKEKICKESNGTL